MIGIFLALGKLQESLTLARELNDLLDVVRDTITKRWPSATTQVSASSTPTAS